MTRRNRATITVNDKPYSALQEAVRNLRGLRLGLGETLGLFQQADSELHEVALFLHSISLPSGEEFTQRELEESLAQVKALIHTLTAMCITAQIRSELESTFLAFEIALERETEIVDDLLRQATPKAGDDLVTALRKAEEAAHEEGLKQRFEAVRQGAKHRAKKALEGEQGEAQ